VKVKYITGLKENYIIHHNLGRRQGLIPILIIYLIKFRTLDRDSQCNDS